MNDKTRVSAAVRALRILKVLKGHTNYGLSNQEIATAINDTPVNVSRALSTLIEEGLVDQVHDNGGGSHYKFAHSIQMLQIAHSCIAEDERLMARLEEKRHRIRAGSQNN
ncbi:helix-turn-helix domain-containing protein [Providencia hangzhouensis]|uniref:helix-turn-helix domain-containing protein n=1 Tax=Providencia hangzhouensis TaxID=3031799 RepID=UPI0024AA525B|nr:helix-turn-helix domain-containing protein [Providencia rettgeri]MDW7803859.1 helix-turn-helix domain-containing protein [Providencia rettgeri]